MKSTTTVKRTPAKTSTPKNRLESPLVQTGYSSEDFHLKVQEKAYALFVARGFVHGFDVEDWLTAEKLVRGA